MIIASDFRLKQQVLKDATRLWALVLEKYCRNDRPAYSHCHIRAFILGLSFTKTRLFKYIENFTSKKLKIFR